MPDHPVLPSEELLATLLADQFPDLAELPITRAAEGWDNVVFRLGDELAVRMTSRDVAEPLLRYEAEWLPGLASRLPLPVSAPLHLGAPGRGYLWPWVIVPWFNGRSATETPPTKHENTARRLGTFFAALHQPAPLDAPPNPYRGVPLVDRDGATRERLDALQASGVLSSDQAERLRSLWETALATPRWDGPALWLHGDPHPSNIVVEDGEVVAVIDFGDICSGDPASDLIVAHYLLPRSVHTVFRDAYGGIDDDTWQRGIGWVVCHTAAMLSGPSGEPLRQVALNGIAALLAP